MTPEKLSKIALIRSLTYCNEALILLGKGEREKAIEKARKAIATAPRTRGPRRLLTTQGRMIRREANKIIKMAREAEESE